MISEEEKIIICSLMAAKAACESAAAGLRLLAAAPGTSETMRAAYLSGARACDKAAATHYNQAEKIRDGREMPVRATPGAPAEED